MSLLDLIISPAAAQAAPNQGSPMSLLVMMVLFFGVFYFMAIRPQMKRAKEHRALLSGLSKGDEVLTNGGVAGRIEDLGKALSVSKSPRASPSKSRKMPLLRCCPRAA